MRVLYLTVDRGYRVINHFDHFRESISKYVDVTVINQKIIGRDGVFHPITQYRDYMSGYHKYEPLLSGDLDYDCIICDAMFLWIFEDWSCIDIPVFTIIEDQHGDLSKHQVDCCIEHGHHIIHKYQFRMFHKDIPKHIKTFWSPHSVNVDMFRNWNQPKEYGVLLTGALHDIYKTRNMVLNALQQSPHFTHHKMPSDFIGTGNQWPVGDDFSKELNKSWLSVTCGADVLYPVMKFFEIPASKSVIYSDYFPELGDLGFVPDDNMISINKSDIKGQVDYLLKNKRMLQNVSRRGYDLIHDCHTNDIRAKELISYMESVI